MQNESQTLKIQDKHIVSTKSICNFHSAFFILHWGPHQRVYRYPFYLSRSLLLRAPGRKIPQWPQGTPAAARGKPPPSNLTPPSVEFGTRNAEQKKSQLGEKRVGGGTPSSALPAPSSKRSELPAPSSRSSELRVPSSALKKLAQLSKLLESGKTVDREKHLGYLVVEFLGLFSFQL